MDQPQPTPQPGTPLMTNCPICHVTIPASFFFCPNCGASLRPAPPVVTMKQQISAYSVAFFLPPFGLWYVWKYIRSAEPKVKRVGIIALVLTVISIIVTIWLTTGLLSSVNQAVNQSLGSYGNLGL
jgi:hypothetical protein